MTPLAEPDAPPSDESQVAVKPMIGEPPSAGATKITEIAVSPTTTVGCNGVPGTAFNTTTGAEGAEVAPAPLAFDAKTVHVYVLLCVSPVTTIGDALPCTVPGTPPSDDKQVAV